MTSEQPAQAGAAAPQTPAKVDELAFHGSPEPLLGVELEIQILDRESGDLTPGAVRILKACEEESVPGVSAELMQSMIEVKTGKCRSVQEVRRQLVGSLARVRNIAASLGCELALAGTHPFHRTSASVIFPDERYERILDRLAWLTSQRVVFGLHVHVGVPSGDMALGAISQLVRYLPHLLALSANSPFWQGVDTGLASSRAALYGLLPHSGVPHHFGKWKDFRSYCAVMQDCKAIGSFKDIYWDIRPRPDLGTIEFRICDTPPTLGMTMALVTLTHCLVISALRLMTERPQLRRGDMRRHWIAVENKWLATRYGLKGLHIRTPGGKRRTLARDVAELIEKLAPIAKENGDDRFLSVLRPVENLDSGADRQRRLFRETGNWKSLTDDMVRRLVEELEAFRQAESATNSP